MINAVLKEEKVTQADEEARRRAEQARQVGLFRYRIVSEVTGTQLSARQRGQRVRELAATGHDGPGGGKVAISEQTIRRWVRWWRAGGFEALVPAPARVSPRTPAEVLALAVALKRENPERTAVQITRILRAQAGWAPSDRTVQRHFVRMELDRELQGKPQVFGRFEASRCNEMWTGDALHGPVITGRKTYLFAFLDDRSRAVMAARFGFSEDTVRLAAALRPALAARGVPDRIVSTTAAHSSTRGCCARAPAWASSSCTLRLAARKDEARSSGSSALSVTSSSSRSPTGKPRRSPAWKN
jgi:putative transposase